MAGEKDEVTISDKWRQGDILPPALSNSILERLVEEEHCGPLRSFVKPGTLVLISQVCDLIKRPMSAEPFAEAIWGTCSAEVKPPDDNSPRSIQLPVSEGAEPTGYVFEDRNRVVFPRQWLVGHEPSGQRMQLDGLRKLIRMVLRRYDRQPLPTEFVKRLKHADTEKKIQKLLRKSQEELSGVAIYLLLNTWKEPSPEAPIENYVAYPLAVYELESQDKDKEARRKEAADEVMNGKGDEKDPNSYSALGLVGLLRKCADWGIQVLDSKNLDEPNFRQCDHVVSESFFTLDHRHEFKPWDFDFLSSSDEDTRPISMYSI